MSGGRKEFSPTPSQREAIHRLEGRLFIAAGAGSGKTAVVANRFAEAVAGGVAGVDEILTITFTRKAAAEMMHRIRGVLREGMQRDPDAERVARMRAAYRDIERARISTIDGFYSGVLRSHALAAGIDPDFATADVYQSQALRQQCFSGCLDQFVQEEGDAAADLISAYDPACSGRLFSIIDGIYGELRSRGLPLTIPVPNVTEMIAETGQRLAEAIDVFGQAVEAAQVSNDTVDSIREGNQRLREALATADPGRRLELVEMSRPGGNGGKVNYERQLLEKAWNDYLGALRSPAALDALLLFNFLLNRYHNAYSARKYATGVLDFEDLSLMTRDLLRDNRGVREELASRLKLIMVDEFQDTNPLQHEIIEMIARDNLMMVGDENQSIYGFRDAEVDLFRRESRAAGSAGCRIDLLENFRSQPEILAFVDSLFHREGMLDPGYLKLDPQADPEPAAGPCRVELIVVDEKPPGSEKKLSAAEGRRVEAELIARRLRELYATGRYAARDTALLVAGRNDIEVYRDALERAGIRTYLAIGINYYRRLELGDSINLFRLLVNPLDDEALAAVLRSPMARVSDDTLFWMRQLAGRGDDGSPRPLWKAILSEANLERIPEADRPKLERFAADLKQLRDLARREPLAETARRVIGYQDYLAATAAGASGKQALANLMKLIDLAAGYEAAWGRDLAAFTDFLSSQKSQGVKEAEPPIEEEGVEAVRIMTMHSAKGLEFPLVVLPKLAAAAGGPREKPEILIDRDPCSRRIGLRYKSLEGDPFDTFHYGELEREIKDRERQEEKRLHYVAMTRAKHHLILTGTAVLDKKADVSEKSRPLEWIRALLGLDRKTRCELDALGIITGLEGVDVGLATCSDAGLLPAWQPAAGEATGDTSIFEPPAGISPDIASLPRPAAFVPAVISPTGLDTFRSCPRRFYLENIVHIRDLFDISWPGAGAASGSSLSATEMGTLVHGILETGLSRACAGEATPEFLAGQAAAILGKEKTLAPADYDRALHLIDNFRSAGIAAELHRAAQSGELKSELSFATLIGRTIVKGKIDALVPPQGEERAALVVDYKTGSPGNGRTAEEAAGAYRCQMAAYALAAHRRYGSPVRVILLFLGGDEPVEFGELVEAGDISRLEAELLSVIDGMGGGDFPPLGRFDEHYCPWCAGGPQGLALCLHGG